MSAWSSSLRTRRITPPPLPPHEWVRESDPELIAAGLDSSARIVRAAVEDRLRSGRPMQLHYDHPLLFLQHMIWHEGYHHGQIKLALKLAGHPFDDEEIGALTWDLWMNKTGSGN
jgi:DinB family